MGDFDDAEHRCAGGEEVSTRDPAELPPEALGVGTARADRV
jgi:hypothetical protein